MCGRYALAGEPEELVEAFDVGPLDFAYRPRYNVAPGQQAPVVAADRRGRRMGLMLWGLVPSWADGPGSPHVNARAESVAEKPAFRESFLRRRCLIPASGFYEWRAEPGGKIPYYFRDAAGGLLALAGLWDRWTDAGGEARHGFTVLTTDANDDVRPTHHRMPVLVPEGSRAEWLDRDADTAALLGLLRPSPAGSLVSHRVSTRVNRATDDDPELIEPVGE